MEELVQEYQPSSHGIFIAQSTDIVLLVGIAGAGKDTIKKELFKGSMYYDLVSHTTRSPRSNNGREEVDGVDYHFINNDKATEMILNREFIEVKFVHGTIYGTSLSELENANNQGKVALTDVDIQGVEEYLALTPRVTPIFIVPPRYDVWLERLKFRYSSKEEFQAEWPKRRASAIRELEEVLSKKVYHVVVNDDLEDAINHVKEITENPASHTGDDAGRVVADLILRELVASRN